MCQAITLAPRLQQRLARIVERGKVADHLENGGSAFLSGTKADLSGGAKNEKMLRFRGRDIEQFSEFKSPPYRGIASHAHPTPPE
jgi:hypothetical protein